MSQHIPRDPHCLKPFGYVVPEQPPLLAVAIRAGAHVAGVKVAQFVSGDRHRAVVFPRQCALWIAFHATLRSYPEMGRRFGRDHTTVLHAVAKIEQAVAAGDSDTLDMISKIVAAMAALPDFQPPMPEIVIAPVPEDQPESVSERHGVAGHDGVSSQRRWFAENDAAFRAAFAVAHPELAEEAGRAAR